MIVASENSICWKFQKFKVMSQYQSNNQDLTFVSLSIGSTETENKNQIEYSRTRKMCRQKLKVAKNCKVQKIVIRHVFFNIIIFIYGILLLAFIFDQVVCCVGGGSCGWHWMRQVYPGSSVFARGWFHAHCLHAAAAHRLYITFKARILRDP